MEHNQLFDNTLTIEAYTMLTILVPSNFCIKHDLALYFSSPITKSLSSFVFSLFSNGKLKSVHKQNVTTTFNRRIPLAWPLPSRKS